MLPRWRMQLRKARLAVADGRWDEAAATLDNKALQEFLPAQRLSAELAARLVDRARQRMERGESSAGWRDVAQAGRLGGSDGEIMALRDSQINARLERVADLVTANNLDAAATELRRMAERGLRDRRQADWKALVDHLDRSERMARRGEFAQAAAELARATAFVPSAYQRVADHIADLSRDVAAKQTQAQTLSQQLYVALAKPDWPAALAAADSLLELATGHAAARQARRQAWKALGMEKTAPFRAAPAEGPSPAASLDHRQRINRLAASTRAHRRNFDHDTVTSASSNADATPQGQRLIAWIDAVGGYLICLGDSVVIGRPDAAGGVDLPIQADLSRRHAVICREGEAYVLNPVGAVAIDGVAASGPTVLRDGAEIVLGDAVHLKFRRPHALSATAVLDIESSHKTKPAVDGVVLMSDSCIFGPKSHSHIACRNWTSDLVLFRHGSELRCRGHQPLEVGGETGLQQAAVTRDCRVAGDDFALSFEEI